MDALDPALRLNQESGASACELEGGTVRRQECGVRDWEKTAWGFSTGQTLAKENVKELICQCCPQSLGDWTPDQK